MELWIATSNSGKINEFKMLLTACDFTIHSQKEVDYYSPPPESGDSFLANARVKARSLKAMKAGVWILGEDSGIEVPGLNNLPGVHSARYAGDHARDSENVAKLLKMVDLRCSANRSAQMKSVLVVFSPEGKELVFEGILKGTIAKASKGTTGFGYDSVFIAEGDTQTLAELGLAHKNKISHRAMAIRAWIESQKVGPTF